MLPPYALLKLAFSDEAAAAAMNGYCENMLDEYSERFLNYFKEKPEGILSWTAILEVVLVVLMTMTNTSRTESLNALLRRVLGSRMQTRQMHIEDMSAKFTMNRIKLRARMFTAVKGFDPQKKNNVRNKRQVIKRAHKRKKPKAGPWRAFLSEANAGRGKTIISRPRTRIRRDRF